MLLGLEPGTDSMSDLAAGRDTEGIVVVAYVLAMLSQAPCPPTTICIYCHHQARPINHSCLLHKWCSKDQWAAVTVSGGRVHAALF